MKALSNCIVFGCGLFVAVGVAGAQQQDTPFGFPLHDHREHVVEATSLLGEPLERPALSDEARARLEANLDEAYARWQAEPDDEMAWVWLGRRLGYLGRYNDAIVVFTAGLEKFPDSYRLRRHRGHRFISIRQFDRAIEDLNQAAFIVMNQNIGDEIEPDGAPNAKNEPRSTTHSNIFYHLALAHYLQGDYPLALVEWRRCLEFSDYNDDQRVSTGYWFYRTLRELDRDEQADAYVQTVLRKDMDVIENFAYHRLLMDYHGGFAHIEPPGEEIEDAVYQATYQYGVAAEILADGETKRATEMLESIVATKDAWPAFGYIAAEAKLAQLRAANE